jgi:hypothetical protein
MYGHEVTEAGAIDDELDGTKLETVADQLGGHGGTLNDGVGLSGQIP